MPNRVEHFPYQDGLLISYWNSQYTDNNVGDHPGRGPRPARGCPSAAQPLGGQDAHAAADPVLRLDLRALTAPRGCACTLMGVGSTIPSRAAVSTFDDSRTLLAELRLARLHGVPSGALSAGLEQRRRAGHGHPDPRPEREPQRDHAGRHRLSMTRLWTLLIGSLLLIGGCQFIEQVAPPGPPATDPLPAPATQPPRFSPSLEIPPPP